MNENDNTSVSSPTGDGSEEETQINQPAMNIEVSSSTNLELTVTKTCLEALNNLAKAFSSAMQQRKVRKIEAPSPYKVKNESGLKVTLNLTQGTFKVCGNTNPIEVVLESGAAVPLQLREETASNRSLKLSVTSALQVDEPVLYLSVRETRKDFKKMCSVILLPG